MTEPFVDENGSGVLSERCDERDRIVAKFGDAGFPYDIRKTSLTSESPMWTARVWAVNREGLIGTGVHRAQLALDSKRVFVFGAESHGAYVEAFDLGDGRPLFRFCTCYWFGFSETWSL